MTRGLHEELAADQSTRDSEVPQAECHFYITFKDGKFIFFRYGIELDDLQPNSKVLQAYCLGGGLCVRLGKLNEVGFYNILIYTKISKY